MEPSYCYILYSNKLNRFYIGATSYNPELRLTQYLDKLYKTSSFTAKADDWILFFNIPCKNRTQAFKIEKHIKRMKSKKYIHNLTKYPNIIADLKRKYS